MQNIEELDKTYRLTPVVLLLAVTRDLAVGYLETNTSCSKRCSSCKSRDACDVAQFEGTFATDDWLIVCNEANWIQV